MTKYYKGKIFENNGISKEITEIAFIGGHIVDASNKEFFDKFKLLSEKDQIKIDDFFQKYQRKNMDVPDYLKRLFQKLLSEFKLEPKNKVAIENTLDIIYEIIEGEDGNLYGKELITGNIFPIATNKEIVIITPIEKEEKEMFYSERHAFINDSEDETDYIIFDDREIHVQKSYRRDFYSIFEWKNKKMTYLGDFTKRFGIIFKLCHTYKVLFSNLDRGEVFIKNDSIANTEEINAYQKEYADIFGNRKKRRNFINKLNNLAIKNVFKWEIVPKKEIIEHFYKDDITKLMERIESHLIRLKSYNEEQYNLYSSKYLELINQDDTSMLKIPITKSVLESLEAKILLCFRFNKNSGNDILEYLEIKKNEYLEHLINGNDTSINIEEIDKIMDLYLRTQNDFDPIKRRKITRYIGLLYLLELIENKDNIDFTNNSYINDNILNIILWIKTLEELDIISYDYLIDLSHTYNIDELLDIIKTIKLNNDIKEKVKKLG